MRTQWLSKGQCEMKIGFRYFVFSLIVLALVGIGLGVRRQQIASNRIEPVVEAPIVEAIYGIGKVEAVRRFHAKAGVPSGIGSIPVKEGEAVRKHDLLVDFVGAPAVRAPFNGIVTQINYDVGESVFAGNVVVEMIDPSEFDVRVVLDQRAALKVKRGQTAKLSFEGLRDQQISAQVRAVYSSDAQFNVLLAPQGLPETILEGMTADVSIEVARKPAGLLIPVSSVVEGKVTRVRDSKKSTVAVKLGLVNGEKVEVINGELAAGDSVLVKVK